MTLTSCPAVCVQSEEPHSGSISKARAHTSLLRGLFPGIGTPKFPSPVAPNCFQVRLSSLHSVWQNCPYSMDRGWACGPQSLPRMQISSWGRWNQGCVKRIQQAPALARAWRPQASYPGAATSQHGTLRKPKTLNSNLAFQLLWREK